MRQLPRESNFQQAIGGERARWGELEHLVASVIDAVSILEHRYLTKNFKNPPKWKPWVRPGIEAVDPNTTRYRPKKAVPLSKLQALKARWRGGKEANIDG